MSIASERNFAAAVRERQRRLDAQMEGEGGPIGSLAWGPTSGDPGWDAFWGSLHDKQQAANEAGLNFRADLGGLGRYDDSGGLGGLNPLERDSLKRQAINAQSDAAARFARAQDMGQEAFTRAQEQERLDNLQRGYAQHVQASMEAPPLAPTAVSISRAEGPSREGQLPPGMTVTARPAGSPIEQMLARLPASVGAKIRNDLASRQLEIDKLAETERHNRATEAKDTPFAAVTDATGKPLTGAAVLEKVPADVRATVQAVLEGRQALPTGTATKDPYWKGIIGLANQADPTFDAVNYNARAQTRKDFTSGAAAKQVNAINTVIGHLSDLATEGGKLGNTDMNWANRIYNALTPGGSGRGVTINNFETLKEGVANELMRVWRQVGAGSEKEIEDWKATIGATKSPAELRGAFKTIGGMLESKLGALDTQYKQGMGTDRVSAISPESRTKLDALQGVKAGGGGMVKLRAPNGDERDVPADQVDHYLALGAKRVGG